MTDAVMLTFTGSFRPRSFVRFVQDRARRLELVASIRRSSRSEIVVAVAGEPELIGAFEMACSLGPHDALVDDVRSQAVGQADPAAPPARCCRE